MPIRWWSKAAVLALLMCAVGALAQESEYQCTQGELLRQVMIVYEIPGKAVPCQVVYRKPSEGLQDQVLWSAANESGYCEFKAREFRAQLESWGWRCAGPPGGEPGTEPEMEQLGDEAAVPAPPAEMEEAG